MESCRPVDRWAALAEMRILDRLPCVPIVGNTAARVLGVKVAQIRGDGRLLAEAQVAAYRRFGYDLIRIFTDLYVLAEAMGAKIKVPTDETAYLELPALRDEGDIESLSPANPSRDGVLPAHAEAVTRVVEAVGREVPVTSAVTGPFTTASFLVGSESLMRLCVRSPEKVHRLCDVALASALAWSDAIIDHGGAPSITDPMSSASLVSAAQFRRFCLPYLQRLIARIHDRHKTVTLHICGRTEPIWRLMADTGADCLSLDNEARLPGAVAAVGDRVRIMGNVPPVSVMFEGSEIDVRAATLRCIAEAGRSPKGFVVATGCSLPTETPFENIDTMLRAVGEIGSSAFAMASSSSL